MRTLAVLTLVEMKLFIREPITMFFTFALPLLFLFVMGGVFGKMTNGGSDNFHGLSGHGILHSSLYRPGTDIGRYCRAAGTP